MSLANDLIEQARHLAKRESKRPRQASLRRAVSTAYYALFHLLTTSAAANWRISRQRPVLARAFDHSAMREVCRKTNGLRFPDPQSPKVQNLKRVANIFTDLQHRRHATD